MIFCQLLNTDPVFEDARELEESSLRIEDEE